MTVQRDYPDFNVSGDTGEDNVDSIQPVSDGEGAGQSTFRRPSENLRNRTEVLRSSVRDLHYYRDAHAYTFSITGGTINWGGTVALGGTGIVTNTGPITARPLLTPRTSLKAQLASGVTTVNRIVYNVAAGAYASDGMNNVTIEHRDGGVGASLTTTISDAPVKRILVVFDAANASHDTAAVKASVDAAVAADVGTGGLAGKITTTDDGAVGNTIAVLAETRLEGTADQEAHLISSGALTSLTTTTPLQEGDALAVWYRHVVEPAAGDPLDPKANVPGGRWESNPDRGNENVDNNLFITSEDPDKIPGALVLCKVVENKLVWADGSRFSVDAATVFGSAADVNLDTTNFAGATTNINNGGIPTTLASPQIQTAMDAVDDRLANLRAFTYVCTDGTASVGGDFNGAAALENAITALAGTGGSIFVRRGTYTLTGPTYTIPADVIVVGESSTLVTIGGATTIELESRVQLHDLKSSAVVYTAAAAIRGMVTNVSAPSLDHEGSDWVFDNVSLTDNSVVETLACAGNRNRFGSVATETSTHITGAFNAFDTLVIGTCPNMASKPSLHVEGFYNTFKNVYISPRDTDFAAAFDSAWRIEGNGHFFDNVLCDQDGSALSAQRGGLRLAGCVDTVIKGARVLMTNGIALLIDENASNEPCDNVTFHASIFRNDTSNATDYVWATRAVPNDYSVSFVDCKFDDNEQVAHGLVSIAHDATSQEYFKYTRCNFIGSRLVGSAGEFYSSHFADCTFTIKNPVSGGVRQLGGDGSGQTTQIWVFGENTKGTGCTLHGCKLDMLDSEVEVGGSGQPDISAPLIASFENAEVHDLQVVRLNRHVDSNGNGWGLFNLLAYARLYGVKIEWTSTAAVQDGSAALGSYFSVQGNHVTIDGFLMDYSAGGRDNHADASINGISIFANRDFLDVRNFKLNDGSGQLLEAYGAANIRHSTFHNCRTGGPGLGIATSGGHHLIPGNDVAYVDCWWYVSSTQQVKFFDAEGVYARISFEGCRWIQLPNVNGTSAAFTGSVGNATINQLRYVNCEIYADYNGGGTSTRAWSSGVGYANTVGAGNIHIFDGGTTTPPGFSTDVNLY